MSFVQIRTSIFLNSWEQNKSFLEQVELKPLPIFLLSLIFHFSKSTTLLLFHHLQSHPPPTAHHKPPLLTIFSDPNTVHARRPPPIANPVMGFPPEPPQPSTSTAAAPRPSPPPSPRSLGVTLVQPSSKKKQKPVKAFRKAFRNAFRSFPIITPVCKFPALPGGRLSDGRSGGGEARVSCTLFGYRKGRVSLSIQENPRTLPMMVVELAIQTHALQKELSLGMVRIAMECEKRPEKDKTKLLEEPLWTMYCNGKKSGYGARREATEEDLRVMEVLKAVSMGAGVIPPPTPEAEGGDGEMAYVRAHFERVVGSKDSETLYMLSPDGTNGPDLSIYFVRI